jgi:hypothetical protein
MPTFTVTVKRCVDTASNDDFSACYRAVDTAWRNLENIGHTAVGVDSGIGALWFQSTMTVKTDEPPVNLVIDASAEIARDVCTQYGNVNLGEFEVRVAPWAFEAHPSMNAVVVV